MCDTKLISLRIPVDLLAKVDAEASRERRSRANVITGRLVDSFDEDTPQPLPEPKRTVARILEGKRVTEPLTICTSCVECGSIAGHQKWCKLKTR